MAAAIVVEDTTTGSSVKGASSSPSAHRSAKNRSMQTTSALPADVLDSSSDSNWRWNSPRSAHILLDFYFCFHRYNYCFSSPLTFLKLAQVHNHHTLCS